LTRAERGDTVRVHYTGRLEDGTVFDTSRDRHPLQFPIGEGRLIPPGIQQALVGMRPGESKTVRIPMEEAYGPYRESLVVTVDRDRFPEHLDLQVGQTLEITSSTGQVTVVTVTDMSDSEVTLDANHPLAGQDLILDLRLIEIT
jgi:FKBP-type peptidyl-prolyl cis-trans isomerase 2